MSGPELRCLNMHKIAVFNSQIHGCLLLGEGQLQLTPCYNGMRVCYRILGKVETSEAVTRQDEVMASFPRLRRGIACSIEKVPIWTSSWLEIALIENKTYAPTTRSRPFRRA